MSEGEVNCRTFLLQYTSATVPSRSEARRNRSTIAAMQSGSKKLAAYLFTIHHSPIHH